MAKRDCDVILFTPIGRVKTTQSSVKFLSIAHGYARRHRVYCAILQPTFVYHFLLLESRPGPAPGHGGPEIQLQNLLGLLDQK